MSDTHNVTDEQHELNVQAQIAEWRSYDSWDDWRMSRVEHPNGLVTWGGLAIQIEAEPWPPAPLLYDCYCVYVRERDNMYVYTLNGGSSIPMQAGNISEVIVDVIPQIMTSIDQRKSELSPF